MTRWIASALVLVMTAGGVGTAAAQSFDLGHLGFGLLGGGPGLGIGSTTRETGTTTPSGAAFGTKLEQPARVTGALDTGLGGGIATAPSRLVPEDIPVGHTEEITSGR